MNTLVEHGWQKYSRNEHNMHQKTETSFKTEKSWGGNVTPISKTACGFNLHLQTDHKRAQA